MTQSDMNPDEARRWLGLGLGIVVIFAGIALIAALWFSRFDPVLTNLALKNFQVIIGLPVAALAAFVVVVFFRQSEQPMTIKLPGIEMTGSSGEVLLWLAVFAVITSFIHLLWVS
jgi:hypothetical protein